MAADSGGLLRQSLVVIEIALSVMLLISAALLIQSFHKLRTADPGFRSEQLLTFRVLPGATYSTVHALTQYHERLVAELASLPEIESAGAVSFMPMGGGYEGQGLSRDDRPPPRPGEVMTAEARAVTPEYFTTMGIRLLRGRGFGPADHAQAPPVSVINQALSKKLFPGEDPL